MSDLIFGTLGEDILLFLQTLQNTIFDLYFGVVTTLGDTLPILIIIVLLYYAVDKEFVNGLVYLLILSRQLNIVTKTIFHHPRPFEFNTKFQVTTNVFGIETVWGADEYSFPSGHSQTQGSIWGYTLSKIRNPAILIIGVLLLVTIPISRSYLGVHWPSDVLFGVLFGGLIAWVYIQIENRYRPEINSWSDLKIITLGILVSLSLVVLGLVSLFFGTFFTFNESISMSDPAVWLETDIGGYPGLLAGLVIGQVLEKKHVNFDTKNRNLTKGLLRSIIGIISAVILYIGSKLLGNIAEDLQSEILWITQVSDFISFFLFGVFMAFIVPWTFTKLEKSLSLI